MSCAVGNDAARDAPKHTAAFIIRAAIAAVIPGTGDMQSVHYDKRGAKITIAYEGDDCATKKDEVEQAANKLCSDNVAMASLALSASDSAALVAFAGCATAGEAGGVTLKKFTSNAAKKCIVVEYIVGSDGAKKDAVQAPTAKETPKNKSTAAASAGSLASKPSSSYDNLQGVTHQMVQELLGALKSEGITIDDAKQAALAAKFTGVVEVPLVALKNTAYTNGYWANMQNKPVSNFIVKRFEP